jgi:hypothetical protein
VVFFEVMGNAIARFKFVPLGLLRLWVWGLLLDAFFCWLSVRMLTARIGIGYEVAIRVLRVWTAGNLSTWCWCFWFWVGAIVLIECLFLLFKVLDGDF